MEHPAGKVKASMQLLVGCQRVGSPPFCNVPCAPQQLGFDTIWSRLPPLQNWCTMHSPPVHTPSEQVPWAPQSTTAHGSQTVGDSPVQLPLRWQVRIESPSAGGVPLSSQVYTAIDEGSSSTLRLMVTPVTSASSGHGRVQSGRQSPSTALASPSSQNSAES
jgi:hypothetical protein